MNIIYTLLRNKDGDDKTFFIGPRFKSLNTNEVLNVQSTKARLLKFRFE